MAAAELSSAMAQVEHKYQTGAWTVLQRSVLLEPIKALS
jgi:hypothetical protein